MDNKTCAIVIPARMGSKRLPKKPIIDIAGKPLISWVISIASKVSFKSEIIVVTDDIRIKDISEGLDCRSILTSKENKNGTERILEVLDKIEADFIINLQGDEPLINPSELNDLFNAIKSTNADIISICHEIDHIDAEDPSKVKVVLGINKNALYFSRSKIPYGGSNFYCHKGIYAFKKTSLQKIKKLKSGLLGAFEDLEQIRWLENNMSINMLITNNKSIGVDTQEDLIKAENALLANNIKALICDVDGTLTNGYLWYGENGEELKTFNVKDGFAIKKLISKGFSVAFLSGRDSIPLRKRTEELGIKHTRFNQMDKKKGCEELLDEMQLKPSNVAYIGDDETDIPCCEMIPFSFAVNNSHSDLKRFARFNLKRNGGEGVIAEFIEKLNFFSTNSKI